MKKRLVRTGGRMKVVVETLADSTTGDGAFERAAEKVNGRYGGLFRRLSQS